MQATPSQNQDLTKSQDIRKNQDRYHEAVRNSYSVKNKSLLVGNPSYNNTLAQDFVVKF